MRGAVDKRSVIGPYDSANRKKIRACERGCGVESPKCFLDNFLIVGGECLCHHGKRRAGNRKLVCGAWWDRRDQRRPGLEQTRWLEPPKHDHVQLALQILNREFSGKYKKPVGMALQRLS